MYYLMSNHKYRVPVVVPVVGRPNEPNRVEKSIGANRILERYSIRHSANRQ